MRWLIRSRIPFAGGSREWKLLSNLHVELYP
jgi:hypothetical protein